MSAVFVVLSHFRTQLSRFRLIVKKTMIVDNYTYSEYCTLPDTEKEEFSTAIRFAKNLLKKDYIGDRDIDEWSFDDVK